MAFGAPFQSVFRAPLGGGAAAAPAASWWLSGGIAAANCLAAYTPKGAGSLALSYDNSAAPGNGLADGTYDCTLGVAPTFNALTGWSFLAASTQYLNTGVLDNNAAVACVLVRYANASVGDCLSAWTWRTYPFLNNQVVTRWATSRGAVNAGAAGVLGIAGNQAYYNGAPFGAAIGFTAHANANFYVGARNTGAPGTYYTGDVLAVAIYAAAPTAIQIAAVSAAAAAL